MISASDTSSRPKDRLSQHVSTTVKSENDIGTSHVPTPGPTSPSATEPSKKLSRSASSRPEKVTRARLETWLKNSVIEPASTAKPGLFEFAGDPTSGCVAHICHENGIRASSPPLSLVGPTIVIDSLSKEGSSKKEDKWLLKANNRWSMAEVGTDDAMDPSTEGCQTDDANGANGASGLDRAVGATAKVGVWGVFDGHGGKQAATYASHALYKYTSEFVCAAEDHDRSDLSVDDLRLPEKDDSGEKSFLLSPGFFRQMSKPHNVDTFALQVEYMKRLPSAVRKAFLKTDEQARKQFQSGGGTTATLAFLCGWQLLVASVGDSQAFLDTGSEVLSVSANHRLEDNEAERARIEAEGGEVAASTVNGKPAGPLRVWPGGLAMSRTIGDVDAGSLCLAEADVVQVTVPKDGARLIIGSDGLWDAVHPKTAAHHTREMTASEASHKLLSMAIKKDHLKDDVTVVVVDIVPPGCEEGKAVPGLRLNSPSKGHKGSQVEPKHLARVWRPLKEIGCVKWVEEELMRRVDEYKTWRTQEEERELLLRRQKEIAREEDRLKTLRCNENTGDGDTGRDPLGQGERKKKKNPMRRRGSRKSLLDELTNLTLDVDSEWTTVGGDKKIDEVAKGKGKGMEKGKKKQRPRKNSKAPSGGDGGTTPVTGPVTGPDHTPKENHGDDRAASFDGPTPNPGTKKKRPTRNRKKTCSVPVPRIAPTAANT